MDELAKHWYQAGSLFIQVGFLIAAVWSVRAILKSVRSSQEQMGALLRLTLSGTQSEESLRSGVRATPSLLDGWPEAAQRPLAETAAENQQEKSHGSPWVGLLGWLQEPMASSGASPWRRAVRWLQAPAGS